MKKMTLSLLLAILVLNSTVYGGYIGPSEVLTTTYGNGNSQVGLQSGDSGDIFAFRFAVSPTGKVAICDEVNGRVIVYKSDGSYERNMNILSTSVVFDNDDSLYFEAEFRKFDKNGNMVFVKDVGFDEIFITYDNKVVGYDRDKKNYSLYSITGQLIKTSSERPLELGVVNSQRVATGRYKSTVKYPDFVYQITSAKPIVKYYRDLNQHFYQVETFTESINGEEITSYKVHKYNKCGKEVSALNLPRSQYEAMPPEAANMPTWTPAPIMEYGEPLVSQNGEVYTWARTRTQYKILKWTWVDDPNAQTGPDAPSGLTVTPSTTGLYLAWKASPNDPGCVTGYEIARATTSGGSFSLVGTVEKGVVKYNDATAEVGTQYYYKVRAVAGSEYSQYTTEVSGKR